MQKKTAGNKNKKQKSFNTTMDIFLGLVIVLATAFAPMAIGILKKNKAP